MIPRVGDVVEIGPECGAQFRDFPWPLLVWGVDKTTYFCPEEMLYLAGWKLSGDLRYRIEHRPMLLVITAGVKLLKPAPPNQLQSRLKRVEWESQQGQPRGGTR